MQIFRVLCWATALVVSGLFLGLTTSGARALGDDDLATVHAGGFMKCTTDTSVEGAACNRCNGNPAVWSCDSTSSTSSCTAYQNAYQCSQCDDGVQNCGGTQYKYSIAGCAGPGVNMGNCTSQWIQTTTQNCAGTCP